MAEGRSGLARLDRLQVHSCEHSLAFSAIAGQMWACTLQVLLPAARERLARIALVKPDKARGVEDLVLQAAQRGQIVERVRACRPPSLGLGLFGAVDRGVEDLVLQAAQRGQIVERVCACRASLGLLSGLGVSGNAPRNWRVPKVGGGGAARLAALITAWG